MKFKSAYTDLLISAINIAEQEQKLSPTKEKSQEWAYLIKECKRELYEIDKKIYNTKKTLDKE